jgi:hypothetical protein
MNWGATAERVGFAWGWVLRVLYDPARVFWLYTVRKSISRGYFNGRWPEGLD